MKDKKNKGFSEKIYCPIFKNKIHCSRLEGTVASELFEGMGYEFCLTKCLIYKRHKGGGRP